MALFPLGLLIAWGLFRRGRKANSSIFSEENLQEYSGLALEIEGLARLESGDFSNTLAKRLNNIFSMTYPAVRPAENIGFEILQGVDLEDPNNFIQRWSKYKDPAQSVRDFVLWLRYNKAPQKFNSTLDFAKFLKSKKYMAKSAAAVAAGIDSKIDKISGLTEIYSSYGSM